MRSSRLSCVRGAVAIMALLAVRAVGDSSASGGASVLLLSRALLPAAPVSRRVQDSSTESSTTSLSQTPTATPTMTPTGGACNLFYCRPAVGSVFECGQTPCACTNPTQCLGTRSGSTPTNQCRIIQPNPQGICSAPPRGSGLQLNGGTIAGIVICSLVFVAIGTCVTYYYGGPRALLNRVRAWCDAQPCCQRKIKPKLVADWAAVDNPLARARRAQGGAGPDPATPPPPPVAFHPIRTGIPPPDGMGELYAELSRMGMSTTNV